MDQDWQQKKGYIEHSSSSRVRGLRVFKSVCTCGVKKIGKENERHRCVSPSPLGSAKDLKDLKNFMFQGP